MLKPLQLSKSSKEIFEGRKMTSNVRGDIVKGPNPVQWLPSLFTVWKLYQDVSSSQAAINVEMQSWSKFWAYVTEC